MSRIQKFIYTTVVGGLLFLVPVVLLGLVLRQAMQFAGKVARPIAAMFPANQIAGVALATVISAALVLLVAFGAGLFSRTPTGRRVTRWVEESFLGNLPQYRVVTSMAAGLTKVEESDSLKPVLVEADGGWQLAYLLEALHDGWVAVFVPQSPTPMSGNVLYVTQERVRPLEMGMAEAMKLVKNLGAGSAESLKSVDLSVPARN